VVGGSATSALVGTFAGLIAVIVVGNGFITAEYRRGLIRVTPTASPRRGRILAAKATVFGAVAFAVRLPAAYVALLLGECRRRVRRPGVRAHAGADDRRHRGAARGGRAGP